MIELPDNISYERWVKHVFDHPVFDYQWWFRGDEYAEEWDAKALPAMTLEYMTRLFMNPGFLLQKYRPAQIDQGLNYLAYNACSNHMFVLSNKSLPWPDRKACFESMVPLYRDLMAPVYGDYLAGNNHDDPAFAINFSCAAWWDMIPIYNERGKERHVINDAIFNVFRQVLQLDSEACLESVLVSLNLWSMILPRESKELAERFLRERPMVSQELKDQAQHIIKLCVTFGP